MRRAAPSPPSDKHTVAWPETSDPAAHSRSRRQADRRSRARALNLARPRESAARRQAAARKAHRIAGLDAAGRDFRVAGRLRRAAAVAQPARRPSKWRLYLWLAIVGTLGSWAILVPAKFAEGKLEDQVPMRLTLLLLGRARRRRRPGASATRLMLKTPGWGEPVDVGQGLLSHEMLDWPRRPSGTNPAVPMYVAYFAFLFLLPRWWRQTEFTRSTRD